MPACRQECCGQSLAPRTDRKNWLEEPKHRMRPASDPESFRNFEEVTVNVSGMTCTRCGAKLKRTLESIPGVSDIRVIFITGTADFKVDTAIEDVKTVLKRLQDMTGFTVSRSHWKYYALDVSILKTGSADVLEPLPEGVVDIEMHSKYAARVWYNPHVVGARFLLERFKDKAKLSPSLPLGPSRSETHDLSVMGFKTAFAVALTIPICVFAWSDSRASGEAKSIASLVLATLVQAIAITEFYAKAFRTLVCTRTIELDMLVVLSVSAAYAYSVIAFAFLMAGKPLAIRDFFETSSLLVALVLVGRLLTCYARVKATMHVSMRSLQEAKATIIQDDGTLQEVDARLLQFGDSFEVAGQTCVSTDGLVFEGSSDVDESMLTGESCRIRKSIGSSILAGTMNGQGTLHAKVTRLPGRNTITDVAQLIECAQASKARAHALADRIAGVFIPIVLTVVVIVFVVQLLVSLRVRRQSAQNAVISAITYCIAVLAVSCPCAIGLAVPMVLVITGGIAARRGVVIRSASATEQAWSVTDIVFDKTGTLTTDTLELQQTEIVTPNPQEALRNTLSLAKISDHPISRALAISLSTTSMPDIPLRDKKSFPGNGVEARHNKAVLRLGSPQWLGVDDHPIVRKLLQHGRTLACMTSDTELQAVFAFKTSLRPESIAVVNQLRRRKLVLHLLSGDNERAVVQAGTALGIQNVHFRQSPEDKLRYVEQLQSSSRRRVLFCGDGLNDAAAMSRADVAVAIGKVSDIVSRSSDVTLLGDLSGILHLLDFSKAAYHRIIFNFVWSGIYNVFAILLAAGAFAVFRLPPAYAGIGELVSVLPVVIAATTMLMHKRHS